MAAADKKTTYTAAEVAALEDTILKQKQEIDDLKRKLEHMNEVFSNAQRARFGQSSEKASYVLNEDQISLFNEAEKSQDHKAEESTEETFTVKAHARRKWREAMLDGATEKTSKAAVGYKYCNKLFALDGKYGYPLPKGKYEYRQNVVRPLLEEYFAWLNTVHPEKGSMFGIP